VTVNGYGLLNQPPVSSDLRAKHSRVTYGALNLNNLNNGALKCDS